MLIKIRFICLMLFPASLLLQNCASSVQEFVRIQDVFKGNTQRDPQNYSLENKSEYRKHNYLLKIKQKEDDKEILKRLEQDKKITKKKAVFRPKNPPSLGNDL